MYLIPTSMSPLIRVCIGGDNLLLVYGDCHARLWDVKTQEFWRAMTTDKAGELIGQGGWAEWLAAPRRVRPSFSMISLGISTDLRTNPMCFLVLIHLCTPLTQVCNSRGYTVNYANRA